MTHPMTNHFKAGLFILVSFGLAVGLFFGITGSAWLVGDERKLVAEFELVEDVGGLRAGDPVRIGGVTVGRVTDVDVHARPDGTPIVRVGFTVPTRYEPKRDAAVAVQAGLTGLVNLNFTSLGTGPALADGDVLDGQPSALTTALALASELGPQAAGLLADVRGQSVPKANAAIDQIRATAADAQATVNHVRSKIDPSVERYNKVADNAAGAAGEVRAVFGDTKGDIRKTMADLSATVATLRERVPGLADRVAAALDGVKDVTERTSKALADVQQTAANARDLTGSARGLIAGNRSRLEEMVRALNVTSGNLASASGEIRRSPWRLLYKPKAGEVANQNLYDAARQFAEGSRKLQDSATALRDALADPDVKPEAVQPLLDKLQADFERHAEMERALWESVR